METAQEILENIHSLLDFDKSSETAVAYGITKVNDNLEFKIIGENQDIYELIYNLTLDKTHTNSNYVTLKTTGWAAPLNEDGEVDGAPSEHPKRRRVRLFVSVDVDNKNVVGSSLKFDDDEEVIYDFNTATGSLAEAMMMLVK